MVHRVQPSTQRGYLLIAHTAFSKGQKDRGYSEQFGHIVGTTNLISIIQSLQSNYAKLMPSLSWELVFQCLLKITRIEITCED